MIYTPSNVIQKASKTGKTYFTADFTDMNGQTFENVSTFTAIQEGRSVDGYIEQNGQYLNFKAQASVGTGGKAGQMTQVMEKKAGMIEVAQDRKNEAISHAGAITNATNLVVAMVEAGVWGKGATVTEDFIKEKVRASIIWYQNLYKNPGAVNPAASDEPPF